MSSPFSWSDTVHITFGSCLPCIKPASADSEEDSQHNEIHNPAINRIPRARPDELQGLLADPDTDLEAETMSLHSNPGRGKRKRRKSKKGSSSSGTNNSHRITLFGYNLFGNPAIQLPEDGEDALYPDSGRNPRNGGASPSAIGRAHSTASTFDSDAAPLDADAINALSSPTAAAAAIEAAAQSAAAAEALRLREKEERRQKRREKKELKKLAEALARQPSGELDGDAEFEGFQGSGAHVPSKSGSGYPRIPNTMYYTRPASDSGSGSAFSGSAREGFGRFVSAPAPALTPAAGPYAPTYEDEDNDAADLDGGLYARKAPRDGKAGDGGSDSRSRTSASTSDKAHHFPDPRNVFRHIRTHSQSSSSRVNSPSHAQLQFQAQPDANLTPELQHHKKPKSKSKSKTSSSRTRSSTTSQSHSPALPSPVSLVFHAPTPAHASESVAQENHIVSPSTIEQGQGFFDLEDEQPVPVRNQIQRNGAGVLNLNAKTASVSGSDFPSARIGGGGGGGFPMTGFGGGGLGGAKRTRDFGAFLARRGDGDDDEGEGL